MNISKTQLEKNTNRWEDLEMFEFLLTLNQTSFRQGMDQFDECAKIGKIHPLDKFHALIKTINISS